MGYVATNYRANPAAPLGHWVSTRTSALGPYAAPPPASVTGGPNFCGQCVSFVTRVCPTIPVNTRLWRKGRQAKGHPDISPGTAIATFDESGRYNGHAAIYESQTAIGLNVVDQWVTPPATAIHARTLRFGANGHSNNGDNFFVVE